MPTKKKSKLFWWILGILFIFYIGNYIALENGYYETKMHDKAVLTSEKIREFEEDVANGEKIDVKKYLNEESIPNNNKYSQAGLKFSTKSEEFMTKGIGELTKFLGKLFGF